MFLTGDKPMTFSGKSYARWTLQDSFTIESRLSLSLKIKTRKQVATIMYAKGKVDYSILEVRRFFYPLANELAKGYSNATFHPFFCSILVNTLESTSFNGF